ncbi:bifunctional phosphopantothenoylcysteine decarboxylase/phosphopantothenate synthase [Georgenia sp. Z1344]|uniref:bifunctional phosphopantothenoylcysteine decarboxylase/phosphopantothenate synthase n=1 Tax=Georgenia sp. Z1344 TaxID=3416706 RepID=UPI003CED8D38
MNVVLGVTGGIAAYKAPLVLRLLTEAGHRVRVVPTTTALAMVGAPTFEALSGQPVRAEVLDGATAVDHVDLGRHADLVLVVPTTANTMARAAAGLADDLLTATLLTATCPVLLAPAMHTEMWQHPATCANVATLRSRGVAVLDPDSGRLTGADTGPGRLPEPERIVAAALALVGLSPDGREIARADLTSAGTDAVATPSGTSGAGATIHGLPDVDAGGGPGPMASGACPPRRQDLAGRRVVVSAGGTHEPLDPVRFIGNRSTGRQGIAIARAAADRGARVTLLAANVEAALLPDELAIDVVPVGSALELADAVTAAAAEADVVVMAAAVADFRPAEAGTSKAKKDGSGRRTIELVENPDILAGLAADRPRADQLVVGFAAETGDESGSVLEHGRAKAIRKRADLLAVNAVGVGVGFGDVDTELTILDAAGEVVATSAGSKDQMADALLDVVVDRLAAPTIGQ